MAEPWTMEQRSAKQRKVSKEAERAAARLGVKGVYLVAFFDAGDGKHYHILNGGQTPTTLKEFHLSMLSMLEKLELSGGEDISVQ